MFHVKQSEKTPANDSFGMDTPLARELARELTAEETRAISGGRPPLNHTNATGPNGDDPADPGDYA